MAVSFEAKHSRTAEYRFLPKDLVVKPELNGRHDLPDIEWLIASILKDGQLEPITIRKDGGSAVLVAGFSRYRAVSEINRRNPKTPIQLRCCYTQLDEQEGFVANIAENRFRNATTEIDDAHNIKRLMHVYQMTDEQVAEVYFPAAKTPESLKDALKWVKKRITLIGITKEAEKAIQSGRVSGPAAQAIAKLSAEQQKEVLKGEGKITGKDIRKATGKTPSQTGAKALKTTIQEVIESGKFRGIGGKIVQASDDMLEFLALLIDRKKKGATA